MIRNEHPFHRGNQLTLSAPIKICVHPLTLSLNQMKNETQVIRDLILLEQVTTLHLVEIGSLLYEFSFEKVLVMIKGDEKLDHIPYRCEFGGICLFALH